MDRRSGFAPFRSSPLPGQLPSRMPVCLEWALLHDQCGEFMLLTGETGTGKTTLLNTVLARRVPSLHLACVTDPRLSFQGIIRVMLPQFSMTADQRGKLELHSGTRAGGGESAGRSSHRDRDR